MTLQFHRLLTIKQEDAEKFRKGGTTAVSVTMSAEDIAASLRKPGDQYCKDRLDAWKWAQNLNPLTRGGLTAEELAQIQGLMDLLRSEKDWWESGRPFFNVWPILYGLIEDLPIDVPWQRVNLPFKALTLCFPIAREPYGMACAIVVQTNGGLYIRFQSAIDATAGGISAYFPSTQHSTVADTAADKPPPSHRGNPNLRDAEIFSEEREAFLLRLAIFIGVLSAKDREKLVTPVLLKRDETRYEQEIDATIKAALVARASRVNGHGFDLGKKQQERSERNPLSPHKRRAHWQRYWVGPGRQELLVHWIDEVYVLAEKLVEVPTGLMGPETPEEMKIAQRLFSRVPVSRRLRFLVLRRDDYRCQLCGRRGTDGVPLEIDHKLPSSLGGPTEEENLWVLCEDCNRGRSNLPLQAPPSQ